MSFLVVQRTHEIGVRMALGAQRADVLRLVLGRAAKLVMIGTAVGLLLGVFSSQALRALLYNVGAFDLMTFLSVTIALAAVSLAGQLHSRAPRHASGPDDRARPRRITMKDRPLQQAPRRVRSPERSSIALSRT